MIIYNETYVMEESMATEWLLWMQQEQLPAILKTGWFSSYKILQVLESPNEGVTYCVQFTADSIDNHDYYKRRHQTWFQQQVQQKFENRFVVFSSVMKEI